MINKGFKIQLKTEAEDTVYKLDQESSSQLVFSSEEKDSLERLLETHPPQKTLVPFFQKLFPSRTHWEAKQISNLGTFEKNPELILITEYCNLQTPFSFEYVGKLRKIDPIQILQTNANSFFVLGYDREKFQYRKFRISKMNKISRMNSEFLRKPSPQDSDKNFHPLAFPIHKKIAISLQLKEEERSVFVNYLRSHPHSFRAKVLSFETSNLEALYLFCLTKNISTQKIHSDEFQKFVKSYKETWTKQYSKMKS